MMPNTIASRPQQYHAEWRDGNLVLVADDSNERLREMEQDICPDIRCGHDIVRHEDTPLRVVCNLCPNECILSSSCRYCGQSMGANSLDEWRMILGQKCERYGCNEPNWYANPVREHRYQK